MSHNVDSWNSFWSENDVDFKDVYSIINTTKYGHLKKIITKKGTSLEVGSGAAHLSTMLAKDGYQATCMDYSEEALGNAISNFRKLGLDGNFVNGDAFNLPFSDNDFDLVFSTGLLEHYEDPLPIVKEMTRVLKPGGVFYSDIVPEKFSLLRAFQRLRRPVATMNDFYERSFTKAEILKMLDDSDLQNAVVFPAGVFPPEIPFVSRSATFKKMEYSFLSKTTTFWSSFDDKKISELLGFYYFAYGFKGENG